MTNSLFDICNADTGEVERVLGNMVVGRQTNQKPTAKDGLSVVGGGVIDLIDEDGNMSNNPNTAE